MVVNKLIIELVLVVVVELHKACLSFYSSGHAASTFSTSTTMRDDCILTTPVTAAAAAAIKLLNRKHKQVCKILLGGHVCMYVVIYVRFAVMRGGKVCTSSTKA